MIAALKESLKRLGRDKVDLYQVCYGISADSLILSFQFSCMECTQLSGLDASHSCSKGELVLERLPLRLLPPTVPFFDRRLHQWATISQQMLAIFPYRLLPFRYRRNMRSVLIRSEAGKCALGLQSSPLWILHTSSFQCLAYNLIDIMQHYRPL
jgi:hypothetical protein